MKVKQGIKDSTKLFLIDGYLNFEAIKELKSIFEENNDEFNSDVIIDLSNVKHIDSFGIAFLVKINRKVRKYKYSFYIANLNHDIEKIFKITNMDQYFEILQNFDNSDFFH